MTLVDKCNTLITTGYSLLDLPKIKDRVREAVKMYAQDNTFNGFPTEFSCSHCGNEHELNPSEIKDALFKGPGADDFVASYNEHIATLKGVPAADVEGGFNQIDLENPNVEISRAMRPKRSKKKPSVEDVKDVKVVEGDPKNPEEVKVDPNAPGA